MEIHFDVNRINKIIIQDKREVTDIKWLPEQQPTKRFFGLFGKTPYYPAGFYNHGQYKKEDSFMYSWGGAADTEFIKKAYLIEDNKAYHKPKITIKFMGDEIVKEFDTMGEIISFVSKIKSKSSIIFEIINC